MSTLAKITGAILFIVGILVLLAGIVVGIVGLVRGGIGSSYTPFMPMTPYLGPNQAITGVGLFAGLAIFLYGLVVITFGEVIYLIGDIARNTQETKKIIAAWLQRPQPSAAPSPSQPTAK
jgi:hypothetical protein